MWFEVPAGGSGPPCRKTVVRSPRRSRTEAAWLYSHSVNNTSRLSKSVEIVDESDHAALGGSMKSRDAACACGQLSVRCVGDPSFTSLCHCLQCQRRTGSAFGLAAFFERGVVTVKGKAGDFTRLSESGFEVVFHFCQTCGSTVYWEPARKPGLIAVAVGCFGEPGFPMPSKSVFTEHQHPWLSLSI